MIHCPPSEHEYLLKYKNKTCTGDYKTLQRAKKNLGIESPIMHFQYLCEEENCGLRFMFRGDILEHYKHYHNIVNKKVEFKNLNMPTYRYKREDRIENNFFTIKELMEFTDEDFARHGVNLKRKKNKKLNSMPTHDKLVDLLKDFTNLENSLEKDTKRSSFLKNFRKEMLQEQKNIPIGRENTDISIEEKDSSIHVEEGYIDVTVEEKDLSINTEKEKITLSLNKSLNENIDENVDNDIIYLGTVDISVNNEIEGKKNNDKFVPKKICNILNNVSTEEIKSSNKTVNKPVTLPLKTNKTSFYNINSLRSNIKTPKQIMGKIPESHLILKSTKSIRQPQQSIPIKIPMRVKTIYPCVLKDFCGFSTRYRINLEEHIKCHSIIRSNFKCKSCNLEFQERESFMEHRTMFCLKIVGVNRYKPLFALNYKSEFINLMNKYELISCRHSEICSFVCNTKEELKNHYMEQHGCDVINYTCMKCRSGFKDKNGLAVHARNYCWKTMEEHIKERKLMKCPVETCDFSSVSVPEYNTHLASHSYTGERTSFECKRCYSYLSTSTALYEHENYFCKTIESKMVDFIDMSTI
uniref:C2H2-type domain-containing protein n=1 Tax=Parastrongyloides trichosuri TaxID=131310 RepID=A0A0N4ZM73_PARTI